MLYFLHNDFLIQQPVPIDNLLLPGSVLGSEGGKKQTKNNSYRVACIQLE